jgi:hypothetical protein
MGWKDDDLRRTGKGGGCTSRWQTQTGYPLLRKGLLQWLIHYTNIVFDIALFGGAFDIRNVSETGFVYVVMFKGASDPIRLGQLKRAHPKIETNCF